MLERERVFHEQRPRLFALAYRMLGGVSDAEDVVQDAWLRWSRSEGEVATPAAFLRTVVTRLCIDRMRSLKSRRETYVGTWLPEPVPDDMLAGTGEEAQTLAESLRFGVLLLLERLSPVQRAVFVLRELLDCEYDEIAAAVGKTATTCRQIFLRAKAKLGDEVPEASSRAADEAVVGAFLGALASRDLPRITALLTDDAMSVSDHGGKARAAYNPIHGAASVAKLIHGLAVKGDRTPEHVTFAVARLSGAPALIVREGGVVATAVIFTVRDGRIAELLVIRNPDKLRHLQAA